MNRVLQRLSRFAPCRESCIEVTESFSLASEAHYRSRAIEKSYPQPDGTRIQVVGLTDFAIEPGKIIALLGASGCGKSTLLRILSGLSQPIVGSAFLAWQATEWSSAECGHRFSELRSLSLAYRSGKCGGSAGSARRRCGRAPQARSAHCWIRSDWTDSKRLIPKNFPAA